MVNGYVASMSGLRSYAGSVVLPNGKVLYLGGEINGAPGGNNSGELYDPVSNVWSPIAPFPQPEFADNNLEVLANGNVLAGYKDGPETYLYNYVTDTWSLAANKLRNDSSDEETWIKLPDGSILSADITASLASSPPVQHAQRYVPSTNTWVDAGTNAQLLTALVPDGSSEIGPGLLLPDGRVFQMGASGSPALYTPATNTWTALNPLVHGMSGDDAPGCVLPSGHVLFATDSSGYNPTYLADFDPTTTLSTFIGTTGMPASLYSALQSQPAFTFRMLMLPDGHLLLSNQSSTAFWEYTPDGSAYPGSQPTINNVVANNDGNYTLTGTQLNGVDEGASYGDDAQMASNYPIVKLVNGSNVYFAQTYNWVSQVATGTNVVSTQFKLPPGLPSGSYSLVVIANGVPSAPRSFVVPSHVAISTTTLPEGHLSVAYSEPITATGGSGSYTFSTTGTLPSGLTLSNTGVLSGTPTALNSYSFTVTVTDSSGTSASETYTVGITGAYFYLPNSGYAGTAGSPAPVMAFPISIRRLEDLGATNNHIGLSVASIALTFPPGVFSFPTGIASDASADVNLGSIPSAAGGTSAWTVNATSPTDGQLNITLRANANSDNILTDTAPGGGSLVTVNFPLLGTYKPTSPVVEAISVVASNTNSSSTFYTQITGNNGLYTLSWPPPYSGAVTINPPVGIGVGTTVAFNGTTTGGTPLPGLLDSNDDLFGTTNVGGGYGVGTVFEVKAGSGFISTLATFMDFTTGIHPNAGLVKDGSGDLFGTTSGGGTNGSGTVFEIPYNSTNRSYDPIKTLWSFPASNPPFPPSTVAGVIVDSSGNLFGTFWIGGVGNYGTLFELQYTSGTGTYTFSTLATFNVSNGANPESNLVEDSSADLFGTTSAGGANGDGTIFELPFNSITGNYGSITVLASFNGTNGLSPQGNLVLDPKGNLFGATTNGGTYNDGTVFELAKGSSSISSLASLNGTNGANPLDGVVEDPGGNLFGAAVDSGPAGDGTVFELPHGSSSITTIASFYGWNGSIPFGLLTDNRGNLFGTAKAGGPYNDGTLFQIATPVVGWTVNYPGFSVTIGAGGGTGPLTFSTTGALPPGLTLNSSTGVISGTPTRTGIYTFTVTATDSVQGIGTQRFTITINAPVSFITTSLPYFFTDLTSFNGSNGANPYGGLVLDAAGNLFGTTTYGGANGDGTVFKMPNNNGTGNYGAPVTLLTFSGGNGAHPWGNLYLDSSGDLFGTTVNGGTYGYGTVFELQANGTFTTLRSFDGSATGGDPYGGVIADSSGNLFGTTYQGGQYGYGTVFELSPSSGTYYLHTLASFDGYHGANPTGGVVEDASGNLYGTTTNGGSGFDPESGASGYGTVFMLPQGGGSPSDLATFDGYTMGGNPQAGLVIDGSGNLFGTTWWGGTGGSGTIFEVQPAGSTFTTLATFNGSNGANPYGALLDVGGNLYGTTSGTVFELPAGSGTVVTLNTFTGANGATPYTALVMDARGNLFGMTSSGGNYGDGTVFVVNTQANGVVGISYNQTIQASGGTGALTFTITGGALPPGLTLSSIGVISGTPTTAGSFSFTITATDALGDSAQWTYTLTISPTI